MSGLGHNRFAQLRLSPSQLIVPILWLLAVVPGCSSTNDPATGDLKLDLQHRDPRIRVDATRQAVDEKRLELIYLLIDNLSHRDDAVRFYTAIAIRKLSGQDLGYLPYATPEERDAAVIRWKEWAAKNAPKTSEHSVVHAQTNEGPAGPAVSSSGSGSQ